MVKLRPRKGCVPPKWGQREYVVLKVVPSNEHNYDRNTWYHAYFLFEKVYSYITAILPLVSSNKRNTNKNLSTIHLAYSSCIESKPRPQDQGIERSVKYCTAQCSFCCHRTIHTENSIMNCCKQTMMADDLFIYLRKDAIQTYMHNY